MVAGFITSGGLLIHMGNEASPQENPGTIAEASRAIDIPLDMISKGNSTLHNARRSFAEVVHDEGWSLSIPGTVIAIGVIIMVVTWCRSRSQHQEMPTEMQSVVTNK